MAANLYGSGETSDDAARKGVAQTAPSEANKAVEGVAKPDPVAALYWREIERYNRAVGEWTTEGEGIEQVYLEENRSANTSTRKFPLLWANVETLKPAVYAKIPVIVCGRRYKDRDPIGRTSAELMERASNTTFDLYGINEVMRMVRDDRLLPGRGSAWVRYEAVLEQVEQDSGDIDEEGEPIIDTHERLKSEKVCCDYVNWKDFGHNISGVWKDVWLVWRIVYKTEEEVADRFGADKAAKLSYNAKLPAHGSGGAKDDPDGRCKIFELWDKNRGRTSWMVEGTKEFLETGPPPIDFMNFFPCPEPAYATKISKSLIPKADYCYYRDQAKEINDLTEKIHNLTKWLIVKGFIPGGPSTIADPLQEALTDKGNSELFLQVESSMEWSERGGAAKLIDWLPIDKVIQALQAAVNARAQLIQDVFQLTGISDILRGQTDPNETLGAQELKAQTGNRRLRNTKDEIARFARDLGALVAEVIAEKFEPQSIADITGYKYQPQMQQSPMLMLAGPQQMMQRPLNMQPGIGAPIPPRQGLMQAMGGMGNSSHAGMETQDPLGGEELTFDDRHMELLRNDKMRSFRIEIETDSTVQPDENAEKQSRNEFANVAGQYLERSAKIIGAAPDLAAALGEILMFTARGFRAGRGLEETLERSFAQLVKRVQQMANNPQPNPEAQKAKAEIDIMVQTAQADQQVKAQGLQADTQLAAQKQTSDAQLAAQKQQTDAQLEVRKQNLDHSMNLRNSQIDAHAQARDRAIKMADRLKPKSIN